MSKKESAEKTVREIRRKTRRRFSAEEKIRIVIEGLPGLYYTGTDAGGHGLGTSNAVFSDTEVAKAVRRYHHTRFGFSSYIRNA